MSDGFKKGSGCFPCEQCGKLTRLTDGDNLPYCPKCKKEMEEENAIADGNPPSKKWYEGNPEGAEGIVKVVSASEGYRGKVIAVNDKEKEAIVLIQNGELWGELWLAKQKNPNQWMWLVKRATAVSNEKEWRII